MSAVAKSSSVRRKSRVFDKEGCIERLWLCVSKRGLGNRFILNARFGAGLVAVVKLAASGFCFFSLGIIDNALAKKTPNREPDDEPAASMMMFCAMSLCFGRML